MQHDELTQRDAATAFAKAWNRLEPDAFLALLAPDAHYASQWVFEELQDAQAIGTYLRAKMRTIRRDAASDPNVQVRAELGCTAWNRDAVLLMQGRTLKGVIVFETASGCVTRYDMCMPELMGAVRAGVFPI